MVLPSLHGIASSSGGLVSPLVLWENNSYENGASQAYLAGGGGAGYATVVSGNMRLGGEGFAGGFPVTPSWTIDVTSVPVTSYASLEVRWLGYASDDFLTRGTTLEVRFGFEPGILDFPSAFVCSNGQACFSTSFTTDSISAISEDYIRLRAEADHTAAFNSRNIYFEIDLVQLVK